MRASPPLLIRMPRARPGELDHTHSNAIKCLNPIGGGEPRMRASSGARAGGDVRDMGADGFEDLGLAGGQRGIHR
jgi:hypothetical protein